MGFTGSYAAMFNSREIPGPVVSARCLNNKEKGNGRRFIYTITGL